MDTSALAQFVQLLNSKGIGGGGVTGGTGSGLTPVRDMPAGNDFGGLEALLTTMIQRGMGMANPGGASWGPVPAAASSGGGGGGGGYLGGSYSSDPGPYTGPEPDNFERGTKEWRNAVGQLNEWRAMKAAAGAHLSDINVRNVKEEGKAYFQKVGGDEGFTQMGRETSKHMAEKNVKFGHWRRYGNGYVNDAGEIMDEWGRPTGQTGGPTNLPGQTQAAGNVAPASYESLANLLQNRAFTSMRANYAAKDPNFTPQMYGMYSPLGDLNDVKESGGGFIWGHGSDLSGSNPWPASTTPPPTTQPMVVADASNPRANQPLANPYAIRPRAGRSSATEMGGPWQGLLPSTRRQPVLAY